MDYPIYDERDFLAAADWETIRSRCPEDEWEESVVHSRTTGKDVVDRRVRRAHKIHIREDYEGELIRIVKERIIPLFRGDPRFRYCWPRPRHSEWLRYRPGMFFHRHSDWEKYKCTGLVPYVCLIGLQDTGEGGQTIVGDRPLEGSRLRNGMILFPGNIPHEASIVREGEKRCLKLEFFAFFQETDVIRVSDPRSRWMSFWTTDEISLMDNFIRSHAHFSGKTDLVVETEMARQTHNLRLAIADPKIRLPVHGDEIFPTATAPFLHDVFGVARFLRGEDPVFMGLDPRAWEFINREMDIPTTHTLMVGIWAAGGKYDRDRDPPARIAYHFSHATDRAMGAAEMRTHFVDFETISVHLLRGFMLRTERRSSSSLDKITATEGKEVMPSDSTREYPRLCEISPSNYWNRPEQHRGSMRETFTEFCNDSERGSENHQETVYFSYSLQVRWCVIRIIS